MSPKIWLAAGACVLFGACSKNNDSRDTPRDTIPNGGGSGAIAGSATGGDSTGGTPAGGAGQTLAGTAGSAGAADDGPGRAGGGGQAGGGGAGPHRCPEQPADLIVPRGTGGYQPAGGEVPSTPTRPQLTDEQAQSLYTALRALRAGGQFSVTYESAGGAPGGAAEGGAAGMRLPVPLGTLVVDYERVDDWDPMTNGIADVTRIVPGYVVSADGTGSHLTVGSAIGDAVLQADCPRVYIRIMPGTYRERIVVPAKTSAPPITIYSTESDASQTVIVSGNSAAGAEDTGVPMSISGSATVTQSLPRGFQAKNLTIANDYVEDTYPGDNQAAVALLNQGDMAQYENVRILGNGNPLYVKATGTDQVSRTYFRDCYVEGDEEIVLGRGTAVFDQCEIHSLGERMPSGGIIGAPSTMLGNPYGLLFINSEFTADDNVSDVLLGRQWMESDRKESIGKMIVRNSTLGAHIRPADPWTPSSGRVTEAEPEATTPIVVYSSEDYYPVGGGITPTETYLAEYGNSGPGSGAVGAAGAGGTTGAGGKGAGGKGAGGTAGSAGAAGAVP